MAWVAFITGVLSPPLLSEPPAVLPEVGESEFTLTCSLLVPNPLTAGLLVREGGVGILSPNLFDESSTLLDEDLVKLRVVTGVGTDDMEAAWAALAIASICAAANAAMGLVMLSWAARAMAPRELWNADCCDVITPEKGLMRG